MNNTAKSTGVNSNTIVTSLFAGAVAVSSFFILRSLYKSSSCCGASSAKKDKTCCKMESGEKTCCKVTSDEVCCMTNKTGNKEICCKMNKTKGTQEIVDLSTTKKFTGSREQVVIELGGTTVRIALVKKDYVDGVVTNIEVLRKADALTEAPEDTIPKLVRDFKNYDLSEVGIASFGPVCLDKTDERYGYITTTPKNHWQNFPMTKFIANEINAGKIFFETDVNAAALAEFRLGGHGARESLAYVTVGTGVGVGVIAGGRTIHGLTHPEGGHISVARLKEDADFQGVCQFHTDCVEGFVTNNAIAKRFGVSVHDLPLIDTDHEVWSRVGHYLAQLCLNITLLISPEVIVIGGGVMNQPNLLGIIHKEFEKLLNGYVKHPRISDIMNYIKRPTFNDAGLYGAALLNEEF